MLDWRATVNQIDSNFYITGDFDVNEDLDVSYLVGGNINERSYDRIETIGKEQVIPRFVNITNYVTHEVTAYQSHRRTAAQRPRGRKTGLRPARRHRQ